MVESQEIVDMEEVHDEGRSRDKSKRESGKAQGTTMLNGNAQGRFDGPTTVQITYTPPGEEYLQRIRWEERAGRARAIREKVFGEMRNGLYLAEGASTH